MSYDFETPMSLNADISQMMEDNVSSMFGGSNATLESQAGILAENIVNLDIECEQLDAQLKIKKANLEESKVKLAEMMLQNNVQSLKLTNGLSPSAKIATKFYKAAGIEDDQLFDFLKANNMGDIIKPFVHFQTMQGALQSFVELGGEVPSDIINTVQTPTIRMNGKSKYLAAKLTEKAGA